MSAFDWILLSALTGSVLIYFVLTRYVAPWVGGLYERLWVKLGIIDLILVYRWTPDAILSYCDSLDIWVHEHRFNPFFQIDRRPATREEKVKVVGKSLVASMHSVKTAKAMKSRVDKARTRVYLEQNPFNASNMQAIVENIWREKRV